MPCTPLTPSSSLAPLGSQFQTGDLAWLSAPPGPCSPGTASTDAIALGLSGSGVRLECFRFSTPGQEIQETPSNESSPLGEQILGALELLRFRESGIGSEYESNTDESDDRDSWGQGEGSVAEGSGRLFNVLHAENLPDCLGDEMAV